MKVSRAVHTAIVALRRNLMRAILTTLGIMIGVAAVIAMVEIGQGSSKAVQKTISSMGANNLLILPGTAASGGVSFGAGSVMTLTPQDADALAKEVHSLLSVAPIVRARAQIVFENKNWVPSTINGSTPAFLEVRDWKDMSEGAMFTEQDVRNASKVCVIGKTIERELFGNISPIGKEIRVQNVSLKVVGVLSSKGANMMGSDQDDFLLAPWTTIKTRISGTNNTSAQSSSSSSATAATNSVSGLYPSAKLSIYPDVSASQTSETPLPTKFTNIDQILTAARSAEDIPKATQEITDVIRERHRIRPDEPDDFNIRDMSEMVKAMTKTTSMMTTLLLCVAMISLLVGGVGIMNIMLVSVTERTREIGLRMAVGARGKDILRQFLIEAVVLCLAGGAIGIVFGRLSSFLITTFLHWPTQSSPAAIIAAVVVSAGVGIIFGFYPAWKASKMDPIEALRYD
jgi:ABC-type antimicrobial peptide transport system permease subunit